MTDLISIIMPVKNGEAYLTECLNSIIDQSATDWELIAVNDHSTDQSIEILKKYSKLDDRISYIHNIGIGIPDALICGLSKSKGTYITRMDCDDIMYVQKLELMRQALIKSGRKSVATTLVEYFSNEKLGNGFVKYQLWLNKLTQEDSNFREIYTECVIPSPAWMVHKQDILDFELFENLEIPEDYDFCFRLYSNKFKIAAVKEILHGWRDHRDRLSRNSSAYDIRGFGTFKLKRFIKLELKYKDDLVLWGCGKKGKELSAHLISKNIDFVWVTENENKIGKLIHGQKMCLSEEISKLRQPKVIVAVSNPLEKDKIKNTLERLHLTLGTGYYFFF